MIQQYHFSRKLSRGLTLWTSKFFQCQYYPPTHLLGLFRKSRPAIRIKCQQDHAIFNDESIDADVKRKLATWNKNMDMMSYSYKRVQVRRKIRSVFWEWFQQEPGSRDGLYVFNTKLMPRDPGEWQEFENGIKRCVQKVNTLDSAMDKMTKADNLKVDWRKVRSLLEQNDMEVPKWLPEDQKLKPKTKLNNAW